MDMNARANDIQVTLTRREFNLVTKALTGNLNPKPHPKCDDNDIPDAKVLGERLLQRRVECAEFEVELLRKGIAKSEGY